jgi:hypothetical protein
MGCPKCGAPYSASDVECARCGVVFAKLAQRAGAIDGEPDAAGPSTLRAVESGPRASRVIRFARGAAIAGLAVWTWQFAAAPMGVAVADSVLHLPNLVFHEAGHVILGVFGRFISVLGGSLFQFAVPLILAGAFLRQQDAFGAAVCTWWAGQNLLDVAPYIADARALQLVLLGGQTGAEVEGHDWEYLLTQMNLLHMDRTIGLACHWVGLATMAGALLWACVSLSRAAGREA